MNLKVSNNNKGFTLVESLVAIAILTVAILGTFTAVQGSLRSSSMVKDRIIAFYMTQEAMEYIKNIRDENILLSIATPSTNWLKGLSAVSTDPCWYGVAGVGQKTCRIDVGAASPNNIVACSGSCPVLNRSSTTDLLGYTSGTGWVPTNFTRSIQLTNVANNEVAVTITISWTAKGVTQNFQIKQLLFNRQ